MEGLGQFDAAFASPDHPDLGVATWDQMTGVETDDPYVAGPSVGGFAPDPAGSTGLVRIGTGGVAPEDVGTGHWSDLMNWRESPLPYFLGLSLLFFGLVTLSVNARVGR